MRIFESESEPEMTPDEESRREPTRRDAICEASHWVVKIGSSVFLRDDHRRVDRPTFTSLVEGIDALCSAGRRVTMVSSGAVALGRQRLAPGAERGRDIPHLQALAALGQSRLMQMYESEFAHYDREVAQILFSRADLGARARYLNARMALERVHELGAVPIINENDTVATEELRFGDNDELAAMTCGLLRADLLVILSDVSGIHEVERDEDTGERRLADRIERIEADDPHLDEIAGPSASGVGRGGMISKVNAARTASRTGAEVVIAPGKRRGVLRELLAGESVGTWLSAPTDSAPLSGRKVWLGAGAHPVGTIVCDAGARRALAERGASLLPSGVIDVEGDFEEGAVVTLVDEQGEAFARGLSVYGSEDSRRIAGAHSDRIEEILGFEILDSMVHRDALVLL